MKKKEKKQISLWASLIPVTFLIGSLLLVIGFFHQSAHIPLALSVAVAAITAAFHGHTWDDLRDGMLKGIDLAMGAVLILMIVGIMIGAWIQGGIVPTMVYYGLKILSPGIFLTAALLICSIVSLGTGSSWSTAGTVGVALIAVGKGLGIPLPLVAGAIISGSYFGDKMSPLSDTTNLAPAVSGTDVFTHVRHMVFTTVPSYLITVLIYFFLGLNYSGGRIDTVKIDAILDTLHSHFVIHPLLLIPPLLVIVMVVKRMPPLPSLFIGAVLGALAALFVQGVPLPQVLDVAQNGFASKTANPMVDDLLNRGGMMSMMNTVALIICALSFGGILEKSGMLGAIARALLKRVHRTGSLIAATIFSCIGMNVLAADQYMAIVVPGRMYKKAYEHLGIHPKNLSRALEDAGTLTSPLVPWNTCGAFMWATLGVYPLLYLPYAFMNLINPLISIVYGYTGFTIHKSTPSPSAAQSTEPANLS